MIKLLREGVYTLWNTLTGQKVLSIDRRVYMWTAKRAGNELVRLPDYVVKESDSVLAKGRYRLYGVQGETELANRYHLELLVGPGCWQGYLLLDDLPSGRSVTAKIQPTAELISTPKSLR